MNDLNELSYFEVNKRLVKALGMGLRLKSVKGSSSVRLVNGVVVNYCNNWSDIGPLIEKYKVSLLTNNGETCAGLDPMAGDGNCIYSDFDSYNADPKRAIAICIIKLLEAKA